MKKTTTTDRSDAYRTMALGKIEAPVKDTRYTPKASVIKGSGDLRSRGGNKK